MPYYVIGGHTLICGRYVGAVTGRIPLNLLTGDLLRKEMLGLLFSGAHWGKGFAKNSTTSAHILKNSDI